MRKSARAQSHTHTNTKCYSLQGGLVLTGIICPLVKGYNVYKIQKHSFQHQTLGSILHKRKTSLEIFLFVLPKLKGETEKHTYQLLLFCFFLFLNLLYIGVQNFIMGKFGLQLAD